MSSVILFSSNPAVQVKVVESGALQMLLTILATTQPVGVKKKVLIHLPITMSEEYIQANAVQQ